MSKTYLIEVCKEKVILIIQALHYTFSLKSRILGSLKKRNIVMSFKTLKKRVYTCRSYGGEKYLKISVNKNK
jgi:hypothetical protein